MFNSPNSYEKWKETIFTHLPHLSIPQATVLALWSYGIAMTRYSGLATISVYLAMIFKQQFNTVRQRLREWYYDQEHKKGTKRQQLDVTSCFAPLLRWIIKLWSNNQLALALDATSLGSRFVVLAISVVYRGCAIPVAWTILEANQKGSWKPHWLKMLWLLKPAIPETMTVLVLADRGLYARWLYRAIVKQGWHPFLRINSRAKFRPKGSKHWIWLRQLAPTVGKRWRGCGTAFCTPKKRLNCTLLACWEEGHEEPWFILTDLPPDECDACWYALRCWIEQGFKCIKRGGWQWNKTRMTDPKRAERLWLAMAVAALWVLSIGSELETVQELDEELEWLNLCPFIPMPSQRRQISIFRLGALWLLARLTTAEPIPMPTCFKPEPWPDLPPWASPPDSQVIFNEQRE